MDEKPHETQSLGLSLPPKRKPAWQHGAQYFVPENDVVEKRGGRVESRNPHDRVAEPLVDRCESRVRVIYRAKPGLNIDSGDERQRMSFEPRACDVGQWQGKKLARRASRQASEQGARLHHSVRRCAEDALFQEG